MRNKRFSLAFVCVLLLTGFWPGVPVLRAGEDDSQLVLVQPGKAVAAGLVSARDVKVTLVKGSGKKTALEKGSGKGALLLETGTKKAWPGITIRAPGGHWDLSRRTYLSLDIRNAGKSRASISCRVDNPGADGSRNCLTETISLDKGKKGTLVVPLPPRSRLVGKVNFIGMRGNPPVVSKLDPSNVTQLLIFVARPREKHAFEISNIHAGGKREPSGKQFTPDTFFPMIDEFGQYIHKDWPGKTHSISDFGRAAAAEQKDLKLHPGPDDRDLYGGWALGPQLKATGFFRVEKFRGKWWFVDPKGRLFWSHGIDCVGSGNYTPISDRENYFKNLPKPGSPFARFYSRGTWGGHGYYKDHIPYRTYDFFQANLLRKYGENWSKIFAALTHKRLKSWGLNTIANWSDSNIKLMRKTPYVSSISCGSLRLKGSEGYWGKFYDVFDPDFRRTLQKRLAGEKNRSAGDPWCIGFFVDNELGWGSEVSLAVATLASPPAQMAKKIFIADLKEKYRTIERLNAAWSTHHQSWSGLLESTEPPDPKKAKADLEAFYTRTAETYFRTIREELKKIAPNQLYLGCRFAWVNDRAARAAAKFCDVVSYNRYAYSVENLRPPEGVDMPILIGEFHFGALDRGMFHTGLRKARNQDHRAQLYADYVRGALRNPLIIGTHWFQFKDQATTGRGDGENYQIGFLDTCDKPYPEIIRAAREVGYTMYKYRFDGK